MEKTPMSETSRSTADKADALPADMLRLAEAVKRLPESHLAVIEPLLSRVLESTKRRRRILSLVQDALSQLRLDMKYLMFDLEATRRERDSLEDRLSDED
jgi:hypothetical protein